MGINFIYDEIEAVISIIDRGIDGSLYDTDWIRLFESQGYQLLKKRESKMGTPFTDEAFQTFMITLIKKKLIEPYQLSLRRFKDIDLNLIQKMVMAYLPEKSVFNTTVIPIIKPKKNSFVHRIEGESYLFIYLEPNDLKARLENKLIHELHHIGLDSVYDPSKYFDLGVQAKKLIEWTNAFGEGFAMLAAAGGPGYHPVPFDDEAGRVWDENIRNYQVDFDKIQQFLFNILEDKFQNEKELMEKGMELMMNNGGQGSWYTVGWRISVIIEEILGRTVLIKCMEDLRKFYFNYNQAVKIFNEKNHLKLPSWNKKITNNL